MRKNNLFYGDLSMTSYFQYDEMTWDAVATLPRDTPLVLSLGLGYDPSTPLSTGFRFWIEHSG